MRGLSLSANYSALVTLAEWSTSWTNKTGHDPVAPAGPKKAILAVVASILTAIYHMLKDATMYHRLRLRPFQAPLHRPAKKRLIKRLAEFGYARGTQAARCLSRVCGNGRIVVARSYRAKFSS